MATKPETPTIAVAVKTFGNQKSLEGIRVKAGTRFAIGKPQGGLKVITLARFNQLKQAGLMRGIGEADMKAAPGTRYAEQAPAIDANIAAAEAEAMGKVGPKTAAALRRARQGQPAKTVAAMTPARPTGPQTRAAARRRTQEKEPAAPEQTNAAAPTTETAQAAAPNGSPTGAASPSSSSPAARPLTTSTFQKRGDRRG